MSNRTLILDQITASAKPFIRIDRAIPDAWCRDVENGSRKGPWRYKAQFTVLDECAWSAPGKVVYFVHDSGQRLRLVGQSSKRLKDRWRLSPMHDVNTKVWRGEHALFHSTAWPAIEKGFDAERGPFTVSALFADEMVRVCRASKDVLAPLLRIPEAGRKTLSLYVEGWVLQNFRPEMRLWNKAG